MGIYFYACTLGEGGKDCSVKSGGQFLRVSGRVSVLLKVVFWRCWLSMFLSQGQVSEATSSLWHGLCTYVFSGVSPKRSVTACAGLCACEEREPSLRPSAVTLPRAVSESPLQAGPSVDTSLPLTEFLEC